MDELTRKLEDWLWNPRIHTFNPVLRLLIKVVRFLYAIVRDVITTTLTLRAMGLVYITIISIVPMLALAFSALKGFGIHRSRVEPALLNALSPLGEQGVELTNQLIGFVDNVEGGLLAGAGLVLLIYTTVSMIKKIEDSLNFIWRVDNSRSFLLRFVEYLSFVLVGPLIMVTAVGLIATVGSNAYVDNILQIEPFGATAVLIGKLTPFILLSLAFTVVYGLIPNTRVRFQAAMVGGTIGGVLWSFSGVMFATFVVTSTRNFEIYASFAIVIIALMWLYVSWLILLIGAQASFYYQYPEYLRVGYRNLNVGNELLEQMALSLMLRVAETFRSSTPSLTTNEIARQLGVPGILLSPVKRRLESAGLLTTGPRSELLPARDPNTILLSEIMQAVRGVRDIDIYRGGRWPEPVNEVFAKLSEASTGALEGKTLYDLLRQ